MTKKDYELIAEHFRFSLEAIRTSKEANTIFPYFRAIILDMGESLKRENSRFDMIKFTKACGLI